jgi:PKD repeat protein
MNARKVTLVVFITLLLLMISACKSLIPDHFEIETTSELGPNTLDRIDDLNDTMATGVEIGPETRAIIEQLNETINDGLEFGFTPDTLDRIDVLLGIVEQGVGIKVGLDAETNATVNTLIDTLDDAPDNWEDTMTEIIHTLEGSTSNVASHLAEEVSGLMTEARINTQYVTASVGAEFRCNVDFLSAKAGDTVDQFIGRTLIGRLKSIFSGEEPQDEKIPTPWVCQIIPDQIDLISIGEEAVFETAVVKLSGYNFVEENKPTAYIVDESGQKVESVLLYPFLSSPYQLQLNLQDIDFSTVPSRSRVVFEWPTQGTFYALAMVLPSEEPEPTVMVQPELTINTANLEIKKGPSNKYFTIGIAVQGATYLVTGHNGDQSWWQIDFENDPGWVPASGVTRNQESVGPASSIPFDPPTASFSMSPTSGTAPVEVQVWDQSTGDPTSRAWQLISGGGVPSQMGSNPDFTHEFTSGGTYTIKLIVENQWGEDQIEQTIVVDQASIVFEPFILQYVIPINPTPTPDYSKRFIFQNVTNLTPGEPFQTNIPTSQYNCSVISLAALHGDIEEHDIGNVIRVWLSNGGPYWSVEANFRTHRHGDGGQEKWSIGLMCADKDHSMFFSDIYLKPKVNNTVSLNPSYYEIPGDYTCNIAGYDVKNVNIEDDSAGDIIQVFTRRDNDGEWQVTADFMDEGGDESWIVQMLCFYDNKSVILDYDDAVIKNIPPFSSDSGGYQTPINSNEYACGIAGMHALDGNVNEDNVGDIIRVYTYHKNGKWHIFADFRTHGQNEMWDIDLMCIHQSVVSINMNQWPENWINR